MHIDRSAMACVGSKQPLAKAEEKATKEKAAREQHKARLDEVQQEL